MGSYTFKWYAVPGPLHHLHSSPLRWKLTRGLPRCRENPTTDASDVLVTGSFDNWTKSVKLEKQGNVFQKTVQFPEKDIVNKIYYKVSAKAL